MRYYNRYEDFLINGKQTVVPQINIQSKTTDKKFIYRVGKSRLDKVSYEFYKSPFFGWLILSANPQYGGLETNIKDGDVIIIPYPLNATLQDYKKSLQSYNKNTKYG